MIINTVETAEKNDRSARDNAPAVEWWRNNWWRVVERLHVYQVCSIVVLMMIS